MTGIREPNTKKKNVSEPVGVAQTEDSENPECEADEEGKLFPGIAIWVAFSLPLSLAGQLESIIVRVVQCSGLSPVICKVNFLLWIQNPFSPMYVLYSQCMFSISFLEFF